MSVWQALLRWTGLTNPEDTNAADADQTNDAGTPAMRAAALERTLQQAVDAYGSADPRSITARNNLAGKYAQIGRRAAATSQFEQALTDAVVTFGDDHEQTDVIRENLAWTYEDAGRFDDAASQWESLLSNREQSLGSTAGDTVTARARLAQCYRRSGRPDAAIARFEQALEDSSSAEERDGLRLGLSMALTAAGRHNDAIHQLRIALAHRQRRLGSRHHDTLMVHHRLGRAYTQAGRANEAVDTLRLAYRHGLAVAGDPDIRVLTMRMRRDLAGALSAAGRHRDAAALF
ncbi:tetratricopeptide (TPR) repeat protein [Lipingzhangella halophila]|uniref:Tetratricopeptide (TPR) repeat protein n=1 Tax=Lipingzhangella halophila TaxID=1783352 RepID=A0A7W7W2P3_9ACTN|nr:tetratricopeptide repeat protein [Lipingzhangella halophila]MBB4932157.1 tetratricopeptide (TPR) repeat protein [Lipingzhangella halophila]